MEMIDIPKNFVIKCRDSNLSVNQEYVLRQIILLTWYKSKLSINVDVLKKSLPPAKQKRFEDIITALNGINLISCNGKIIDIVDRAIYMSKKSHKDGELLKQCYEFADYWNSKNIVIHSSKTINKSIPSIKSAILEYGLDELKKSLDNYSIIIEDDRYWFSHAYFLMDFLNRAIDRFLTKNKPFITCAKNKPKTINKTSMYRDW